MNNQIIVRARGLIFDRGHVLLTKAHKQPEYLYLPGGKVEVSEFSQEALVRELNEELGMNFSLDRFICCLEQRWHVDGVMMHEINIIFHVINNSLSYEKTVQACEDHISFVWVPLVDLAKVNLLPQVLVTHIPLWVENKEHEKFISLINV